MEKFSKIPPVLLYGQGVIFKMKNIEDLTEKEIETLEETLLNNLYDRRWCGENNINYCNPNVTKARELVYGKYFKNGK